MQLFSLGVRWVSFRGSVSQFLASLSQFQGLDESVSGDWWVSFRGSMSQFLAIGETVPGACVKFIYVSSPVYWHEMRIFCFYLRCAKSCLFFLLNLQISLKLGWGISFSSAWKSMMNTNLQKGVFRWSRVHNLEKFSGGKPLDPHFFIEYLWKRVCSYMLFVRWRRYVTYKSFQLLNRLLNRCPLPPPNPVQLSTGLANDAWCSFALMRYKVMYICFEFEEKTTYLIFPTSKGSINACMDLVGLGTSIKVKNHCPVSRLPDFFLYSKVVACQGA